MLFVMCIVASLCLLLVVVHVAVAFVVKPIMKKRAASQTSSTDQCDTKRRRVAQSAAIPDDSTNVWFQDLKSHPHLPPIYEAANDDNGSSDDDGDDGSNSDSETEQDSQSDRQFAAMDLLSRLIYPLSIEQFRECAWRKTAVAFINSKPKRIQRLIQVRR
jgi:hypothetical protein